MKKIKVIDIIPKKSQVELKTFSKKEIFVPSEKKIKIEPIDEEKGKILEGMIKKEEKNEREETRLHRARDHRHSELRQKSKSKLNLTIFIGLAAILFGSLGYLAVNILPRADIKIVSKKSNWEYGNSIVINPKIADIDSLTRQIPAAVFYEKRNAVIPFPATGKKYGDKYADGAIIIYNNYGTNPQTLVAGTRFQAPDGKIFKLKEKTVAPGAKNGNGKLTPSSVEANIIAEKPGSAYNIPAVKKFTIPGFIGSDKFEKFYGESKTPMTGGTNGELAYPTDDDIDKAKQNAESQIKDIVNSFIYSQIPENEFKIIDSGKQFKILKEIVNKNTDENGNFSVFIEAEGTAQAFKESQLVSLMNALGQQAIGQDFELKDKEYTIEYGAIQTDPKTKIMTLPVNFKGTFWKPFNIDDFKTKIAGKSETDLKSLIFSFSNIEKANISFWPFWVSEVPDDAKRIKISLD
ncbi:MAG: hypothetical protein QMD86_01145 [Patescibacteria group bacterium]|nr:hypothetical protein [Patescibacteria group bacterium]